MTRRELVNRIGADEADEWLAYWRLRPALEDVLPIMLARLCQLVAQAWLKKESGGDFTLDDFLPAAYRRVESPAEKAEQSTELQIALAVSSLGA